ncbi:feo [Drosophila busckii]|uniref:Feo n=2 Tax=Drosophila busckii TaxID=30019 RepID=A0A0M4F874_DROBS|nr:feo [Drosophila busckii]
MEDKIKDDIKALRVEAADVTRLLHKNVDIGNKPDDMPLVVWQEKLDRSIQHLRDELRMRRDEICELLLQQELLCEELGESPLPLLADPLPKPHEMSAFRDHLERLRAKRTRCMDEMFQLRSQIKQDMKQLELVPQSDADEQLLSQANLNLSPDVLIKLRLLQEDFAAQVVMLHERIDDMREKIKVLWQRLEYTDEFAMRQVNEATSYTQRTYDVLNVELQHCQQLRRRNLKGFIEQLRLEIKKWWDLTLKSQQERKRFSNYYNDWYNEDLLELHELELDDLKTFYNSNKDIFELFANRAEVWERMVALEAKANDPNRFNNRGGQLLKEERERKTIMSKLPKIEQQIKELVLTYEKRTKCPFLVHGESILQYMENEWESLRKAKEQQSSARKNAGTSKMMPPPAAGTTAPRTPMALKNMSAMSSSTMSLRKTPSNWQLSSLTGSAAKTTGNLHKRKLPHDANNDKTQTPNAKRSLKQTLDAMKASPAIRKPMQRLAVPQHKSTKSPMRKVLVLEETLRRRSGRHSMGKQQATGRTTNHKVQAKRKLRDEHDDYTTDENEMDNYEHFAPPARSSEVPRMQRPVAKLAAKSKVQSQPQPTPEDIQPHLPRPRRSKLIVQPNRHK